MPVLALSVQHQGLVVKGIPVKPVVFKYHFHYWESGSIEKWLIPGQMQEMDTKSLGHLVVPESGQP